MQTVRFFQERKELCQSERINWKIQTNHLKSFTLTQRTILDFEAVPWNYQTGPQFSNFECPERVCLMKMPIYINIRPLERIPMIPKFQTFESFSANPRLQSICNSPIFAKSDRIFRSLLF